MSDLQIAIGPMLFLWQKQTLDAFYLAAAQSNADIVYVGETVCAKRRLSKLTDYLNWAAMLAEAGKTVVLSTMTLLESAGQLAELKRICKQADFLVEANDLAAVQQLHEHGLPFVIGPAVNVYNGFTLAKLAKMGAVRWVMPVELSKDWLVKLQTEYAETCDLPMQYEVLSYGYLPLAYSARCFTARHYDLDKDQCELICQQHAQGLATFSQEGQRVFTLNGTQTMSGDIYNLCEDVLSLRQVADVSRLSMHQFSDLEWVDRFLSASTIKRPADHINGFWHQLAGINAQY
ncbi:MAG: U32 family peptidase [Pseudoalteromonas sp.]|uniref:U32 family peptidase n=1 Tax=Pseudoalteromonas sp. TaxID=53249 RepID=UPI000C5BDF90|nr:U32 family peptidase [Pseudoalteromonas sp.]MAB62055.1 U32 family peptidase [Pseudoalteromonas sp.]NRA81056.1 U32 family peptidase [Pseudoalteromonas sp.]